MLLITWLHVSDIHEGAVRSRDRALQQWLAFPKVRVLEPDPRPQNARRCRAALC